MVIKVEYDFLNWKSFPSSFKLINDGPKTDYYYVRKRWTASPGDKITTTAKVKQQNAMEPFSPVIIRTTVNGVSKWISGASVTSEAGTLDWRELSSSYTCPPGTEQFRIDSFSVGPAPSTEKPCIVWLDDLKIYQNDVLIYSDDFSKWDPLIGAGVGAGILGVVVPALVRIPEPGVAYEYQKPLLEKEPLLAAGLAGLGILVGGGIGLLTGLGIIPVPQILALGAAPEGPGAPARLGKYQITG